MRQLCATTFNSLFNVQVWYIDETAAIKLDHTKDDIIVHLTTSTRIYVTYDYENLAFKLWYDGSRTFYEKKKKKKHLEQNNK